MNVFSTEVKRKLLSGFISQIGTIDVGVMSAYACAIGQVHMVPGKAGGQTCDGRGDGGSNIDRGAIRSGSASGAPINSSGSQSSTFQGAEAFGSGQGDRTQVGLHGFSGHTAVDP